MEISNFFSVLLPESLLNCIALSNLRSSSANVLQLDIYNTLHVLYGVKVHGVDVALYCKPFPLVQSEFQ